MAVSAERVGADGNRARAGARAGEVLREGGVVVASSESAYVALAESGERLRAGAWARLLDGNEALARALGERVALSGVQERLVRRLAPGPVIFVRAGEEGGWRAPAHEGLRAILRASGIRAAAVELAWGGRAARTAEEGGEAAEALGLSPALVVDGGVATLGRMSTVIALTGGGHEVTREGAYERRFVEKQTEQRVLFVCTGNTCRSPMAEAIAAEVIRELGAPRMSVSSAGVAAGEGAAMSGDALWALQELGVEPARRRSRRLTREMIAEADLVLTMTASHRLAVLSMEPSAAERVETLDPAGDVPDPIGLGREVYLETARRISELVRRRLKEAAE